MYNEKNIFQYGMITQQQREQLYHEVWTDPLKIVAKKYEISDTTLRKYCTKFGVPLPPRGYWDKVKKGEQPKKRELPPVIGDLKNRIRNYVIQFQPNWQELSDEELRAGEGLFLLTEETQAYIQKVCSEIDVKSQLRNPHPLIIDHQEEIKRRNKRDREIKSVSYSYSLQNEIRRKYGKDKNVLPITVSPKQIKRAYRLLDAFIGTLAELEGRISFGHDWQKEQDVAYIYLMSESFNINVVEHDKKKRKSTSQKNNTNDTEEWKPLKFVFATSGQKNTKTFEYIDSDSSPLEEQLGKIFLDLFIYANYSKAIDLIKYRQEKREWEEQQRKWEFEKLQKKEHVKLEALQELMKDWETAQKMRQFAVDVESNIELIDTKSQQKAKEWVQWIRGKADWMDPTVAKEDELIGKRHDIGDILTKFDL